MVSVIKFPPSELVQEVVCVQVLLLVTPSEMLLALVFFLDKEFSALFLIELLKLKDHYEQDHLLPYSELL